LVVLPEGTCTTAALKLHHSNLNQSIKSINSTQSKSNQSINPINSYKNAIVTAKKFNSLQNATADHYTKHMAS